VHEEDYMRKACENKNKLANMGEIFFEESLIEPLLNGLSYIYESIIQLLTHQIVLLIFEQGVASLLVEEHCCEQRVAQFNSGDEEVLFATNNHESLRPFNNFFRFLCRFCSGQGGFYGRRVFLDNHIYSIAITSTAITSNQQV
jgi:hypothetical protein